jgi:hypothetical protein
LSHHPPTFGAGSHTSGPATLLLFALLLTLPACDDSHPFADVRELAHPSSMDGPRDGQRLEVTSATGASISLAFDKVDAGTGIRTRYDVRYRQSPMNGWDASNRVVEGSCADGGDDDAVDGLVRCDVSGLEPATSYDFRVRALYDHPDGDAVAGPLSNIARGTTLGGGSSHEPSGYATFTERSFTARDDAGWSYNESSNFRIVEDTSAPAACCSVAEARFPRGFEGGRSPLVTWHTAPRINEIYISFHMKVSSNWQGHGSGVNKLGFVWIHDDASVYFSAQGSGSSALRPRIRLQDVPGGSTNLAANAGDPEIERGKWHHWEIQLVANTPGRPDGVARLWLDGELVTDYRDVTYSGAGQTNEWQAVYWYPVWGGMGETVREDMSLFIDRYYASGR